MLCWTQDTTNNRNCCSIILVVALIAILTYMANDPNSIIAILILCIPGWLFYSLYWENTDFNNVLSPNLVIYLFVTGFSSVAVLAFCCQYTVLAVISNLLWGISVSAFVAISDEVGTVQAVLQLSNQHSIVVCVMAIVLIAFGVAAISEEMSKYFGFIWTSLVDTITKSKLTSDFSQNVERDKGAGVKISKDVDGKEGTLFREYRSRSGSAASSGVGSSLRFNIKTSQKRRRQHQNEDKFRHSPYRILLTMLIIGLGFATMEALTAVCSSSLPMMDRARMALWRTLLATTIHLTCCLLTAIGIIKKNLFGDYQHTYESSKDGNNCETAMKFAQITQNKSCNGALQVVLPAILIHGMYDLVTFVVSHYLPIRKWNSKQGMQWILLYGLCICVFAYIAVTIAVSQVPFRQLHENPNWEGLPIHRMSMASDDRKPGRWCKRMYRRRGPNSFINLTKATSMRNRIPHKYLV